MADISNEQPYLIWALGAVTLALSAFLRHLFSVIKTNRDDANAIADGVRQELLRTQAQWDTKLEIMRQEANMRWHEGREDRKAIQDQMQEFHRIDLEQHEHMIASIANLPMVITALLRDHRGND